MYLQPYNVIPAVPTYIIIMHYIRLLLGLIFCGQPDTQLARSFGLTVPLLFCVVYKIQLAEYKTHEIIEYSINVQMIMV